MSYKIGSFNMYKFQAFLSDEEHRKEINKIAQIIQDEQFSVMALQEIFSKQAMEMLLKRLGLSWEGRWCSPPAKSSIAAEGYAFIWNTNIFKLVETVLDDGTVRQFEPHIFNQYRINRAEGQEELVRNPYYARFEPVHGPFFELRLINTHIMFSKSKTRNETNEEQDSLSDVKMRKNEFNVLTKALYPKISDKVYGNNRPGYTIMLGDYNLNLKSSGANSPYLEEAFEIKDGNVIKHILTLQKELTTLKRPPKDGEEDKNQNNYWANNYDHFTIDANRFAGAKTDASRVDSVHYCENYAAHRKEISDHVPIKMSLDLRNGE